MNNTYRQIKEIMRVGRGSGRPDLISVRPCIKDKHGNRTFKDSDEKPTLITFDEHCQIADLPFWLKIGALVQYTPPMIKAKKEVGKEVRPIKRGEVKPSGEGAGKPELKSLLR